MPTDKQPTCGDCEYHEKGCPIQFNDARVRMFPDTPACIPRLRELAAIERAERAEARERELGETILDKAEMTDQERKRADKAEARVMDLEAILRMVNDCKDPCKNGKTICASCVRTVSTALTHGAE